MLHRYSTLSDQDRLFLERAVEGDRLELTSARAAVEQAQRAATKAAAAAESEEARAQESSGSDPDLRQFARDTLPHLEHHLEMLQGANTQK